MKPANRRWYRDGQLDRECERDEREGSMALGMERVDVDVYRFTVKIPVPATRIGWLKIDEARA